MRDGHAGLFPQRLEAHLDPGLLARREGSLAPGDGKAHARIPGGDAVDLEGLARGARLREPAAPVLLQGQPGRR
jgi:hypothetical protein